MAKSGSQEIDTTAISRAAIKAAASIPHTCSESSRLDDHSDRIKAVEERINQGNTTFAEIRKDIEALTKQVGALTSVLLWVGGIIGAGLLGTAGTALVWVLGHMGGGK